VSTGVLTLALFAPLGTVGDIAYAEPGVATSSRALQSQADVLRAQVDELRLQQSIAAEAYDTAVEETSEAITAEVRAQSQLDAASGDSDDATTDATRRVRALYMAGGATVTGLGRVLTTGDLTTLDAAARAALLARSLVSDDTTTVTAAATARADAAGAEAHLRQVRADKTAAQAAAESAEEQLTTAVAQQQSLLAAADTAVAQAVAEEEERARQDALAAAAQRAAAAGVVDAPSTTAGPAADEAGDPSVADTVAGASSAARAAIAAAGTREGMSYVWGATGPTTFDCSGLTQWAYEQAGVSIPRTSRQQYASLPKVPLDRLQPGDLVFYANGSQPSSIHHVALYLGGGKVLHAPHTGDVVREAGVAMSGLYGAVRPSAGG
jgi:cell wall-associated NlpC family hydrolase